jgi:inosine/xanthosine triphosphate pyrophosphatase family protein
MPTILFATLNPWKKHLFQPAFSAYGLSIITLQDVPAGLMDTRENGATAVENALSKARQSA